MQRNYQELMGLLVRTMQQWARSTLSQGRKWGLIPTVGLWPPPGMMGHLILIYPHNKILEIANVNNKWMIKAFINWKYTFLWLICLNTSKTLKWGYTDTFIHTYTHTLPDDTHAHTHTHACIHTHTLTLTRLAYLLTCLLSIKFYSFNIVGLNYLTVSYSLLVPFMDIARNFFDIYYELQQYHFDSFCEWSNNIRSKRKKCTFLKLTKG